MSDFYNIGESEEIPSIMRIIPPLQQDPILLEIIRMTNEAKTGRVQNVNIPRQISQQFNGPKLVL